MHLLSFLVHFCLKQVRPWRDWRNQNNQHSKLFFLIIFHYDWPCVGSLPYLLKLDLLCLLCLVLELVLETSVYNVYKRKSLRNPRYIYISIYIPKKPRLGWLEEPDITQRLK